MKVVSARAGDDVDDRSGGLAVLSRVGARENLVFRDRIRRIVATGVPERVLVVAHTVDEKRVAGSGAAGARDGGSIRHARGDSGREDSEALEVAPGQGKLVELLPRDRRPDGALGRFDDRSFPHDGHRLRDGRELEGKVEGRTLADGDLHARADLRRKSLHADRELVVSRAELRQPIGASGVRDRRPRHGGAEVSGRDRSSRQRLSRLRQDPAGHASADGLSPGGH